MDVFKNTTVRNLLFLALVTAAVVLLVVPDTARDAYNPDPNVWLGLVGAGFLTAAYIGYQFNEGRVTWIVGIEAFIIASFLSAVVIYYYGRTLLDVPLLCAILILVLSSLRRWEIHNTKEV